MGTKANLSNLTVKIWNWCKKEAVLTIAFVLAIVSAFFVHPDKEYLGYIDFRTLGILFCLMAVMAGLQKVGLFKFIAEKLLKTVNHIRGLIFILVMLCFFSSMLKCSVTKFGRMRSPSWSTHTMLRYFFE